MSNWYGASRTNYVPLVDVNAFKALAFRAGLKVITSEFFGQAWYGLLPGDDSEDGCFPSHIPPEGDPGDEGWSEDDGIEFDLADFMPFIEEGHAFIVETVGHEKLRYLTGHAIAWVRRGQEVQHVGVSIQDAAVRAVTELGCVQPTLAQY